MKYTEFHRMIVSAGWKYVRATGSHYFYEKDGKLSEPIPFHGAKEMREGTRRSLAKKLGLL